MPLTAERPSEQVAPPAARPSPVRPLDRRPLRFALEGLVVATTSLVVAVAVYGMWSFERLAETFGRGDVIFHTALVRSMQLTGEHSAGRHLGAPNGQEMLDFPLGADRLHLVALRLLSELPLGAIAVVNLYYVLSFAVIAGVTHVTLRSLGCDTVPAAGAALLFAFLPYHLEHGISHLFLSMYPAVPLAVLLGVWVADGRLRLGSPRWRWAVAAVCVLVVGSTSAYYATFGAICIVTAAAVGSLRGRDLRPLGLGVATAAAIGVVLVVNLTPTLLHRRAEGDNIEAGHRLLFESDVYGLRPATMVVPQATHRIPAFARLGIEASLVPSPGEPGTYIGLVAVVGLAVLLVACIAAFAGRAPPTLGLLAAMFLSMLLMGSRGGGGFLVALAGFTDLRGWSRTSLVIGLLALGALALVGTAAAGRVGRPAVAAATAVLVVLGLFDQIPREPIPKRAAGTADLRVERRLVRQMEDALPAGAMVYQLPYHRFPEAGPVRGMGDYDPLRPYILGRGRLRWSTGGMRGRSADWQDLWAQQPPPVHVRAVAAAGFSALFVDLRAYGAAGDALLDELEGVTGAPPHRSEDGALAWYDLRPTVERIRSELGPAADGIRRAITTIPEAVWAHGFEQLSPSGFRGADNGAALHLRSATRGTQHAVVVVNVDVPVGTTVSVETDQGAWRSSGAGRQHGRLPVRLGEDRTEVRVRLTGVPEIEFFTLMPVDAAALRLLPEPVPQP